MRHPALYPLFVLQMIFLVALPKGGIDVMGLPLTFGYLMLAGVAPLAILASLRHGGPPPAAIANFLIGFVPISVLALIKLLTTGTPFFILIYAHVLVVLPAAFLLIYAPVFEMLSEKQIGEPLKWCLRFAVFWGLMNFVIFAVTRKFIEIPYLTVNPLDIGSVYIKNNRRGVLMKLVSTYNNGNIYGICTVVLLPIYWRFERSRIWRSLYLVAIVLSLSRTVWAGLVVAMLGMVWSGQIRLHRPVPWLALGAAVLLVIGLLPLMGWTTERVVDTNLGGRIVYWDTLVLSAFGQPDVRMGEVLYAGLLQSFGIIGTVFAVIAYGFPVVYGIANRHKLSPLRRGAVVGVACYLLMATSDAAFIYPPTIAIVMAVSCLIYRRGYEDEGEPASAPQAAPYRPLGPVTLAQAAARLR